jgi:hypothetical protein
MTTCAGIGHPGASGNPLYIPISHALLLHHPNHQYHAEHELANTRCRVFVFGMLCYRRAPCRLKAWSDFPEFGHSRTLISRWFKSSKEGYGSPIDFWKTSTLGSVLSRILLYPDVGFLKGPDNNIRPANTIELMSHSFGSMVAGKMVGTFYRIGVIV